MYPAKYNKSKISIYTVSTSLYVSAIAMIIHKFIIYQVVQVLTHPDDLTFLRRGLQHGQMQWGPVQVVLLYTVGPEFGWRPTASKDHKSMIYDGCSR
jgi:hypothetical protein